MSIIVDSTGTPTFQSAGAGFPFRSSVPWTSPVFTALSVVYAIRGKRKSAQVLEEIHGFFFLNFPQARISPVHVQFRKTRFLYQVAPHALRCRASFPTAAGRASDDST